MNACSARSCSVGPASRSTRRANARAASTNTDSFKVESAANGVFECVRRGHEKSPFGASNEASTGSGIERRRNMYKDRRYRSGAGAVCQKSAAGMKLVAKRLSGTGGKKLGPPRLEFRRPATESTESRAISA